MKLNFGAVLGNLAQTQAGLLEGRRLAEEELRRRRLQQQQQEEQFDQTLAGIMPKLDKPSQEKALQYLLHRSSNRAAGRPSDYGLTPQQAFPPPTAGPFGPQTPSLPVPPPAPAPTTATAAGAGQPQTPAPSAFGLMGGGPAAVELERPVMAPAQQARPTLRPQLGDQQPAQITPPRPQMGIREPMPKALRPQLARPEPTTVITGQRPKAPAVAPAAAPLPPDEPKIRRRAVEVPGLGKVYLRGVTEADAKAMRTAVEGRVRFLSQIPDLDPALRQQLAASLGTLPSSFDDEGDYQAGRQFLQGTMAYIPGGALAAERVEDQRQAKSERAYETAFKGISTGSASVAAARLPALLKRERALIQQYGEQANTLPALEAHAADIQEIDRRRQAGDVAGAERMAARVQSRLAARLTPSQEASREANLHKLIDTWPIAKANNPDAIRRAYANRNLTYLLEGVPDSELRFGTARAERQFRQLYSRLPGWAEMPKALQRDLAQQLGTLAHEAGVAVKIPTEFRRQLTPAQAKQIEAAADRFRFQQERFAYTKDRNAALDARRAAAQAAKGAAAAAKTKLLAPAETGLVSRYLHLLTDGKVDKYGKFSFKYPNAEREAAIKGLKFYGKKGRLNLQGVGLEDYSAGTADTTGPAALTNMRSRVDLTPLTPAARQGLADVDAFLGQRGMRAWVTSAHRTGGRRSAHQRGDAFDLSLPGNRAAMQQLATELRDLGLNAAFEFKGQRNENGSVATGDHIHVQFAAAPKKNVARSGAGSTTAPPPPKRTTTARPAPTRPAMAATSGARPRLSDVALRRRIAEKLLGAK